MSIPIVYLSTEPDFDKQLAALDLGGDDFLTKPVSPQQLVRAVRPRAKRYRSAQRLNAERRELVAELENQRAALNMHSIACVFGTDGRIVSANDKFTDVTGTNLPSGSTGTYWPAVGDIDEDGDTDVVLGIWSGSGVQNVIYVNDGKGKFGNATSVRSSMVADSTTSL